VSNTEIDRFLEGLNFVENPWTERAFERSEPKIGALRSIAGHCAAVCFGVMLGTVLWQALVYVTIAEVVLATAQVK